MMQCGSDTEVTKSYAVRSPETPAERRAIDGFLARHPDITAEWFDPRDDDDLDAALSRRAYDGCVFANVEAALDAAIAGNLRFELFERHALDLRLCSPAPGDASAQALAAMLTAATAAARRRRAGAARRQAIAGSILSLILVLAIAGLLIVGTR